MNASDLRGASRLAIQATLGLTHLVENLHHNILRTPLPLGETSHAPTTGITGLVYRSIRGVTRLVGGSLDALLGQAQRLTGTASALPSEQREAVLAALNGVLGDQLQAKANPLAISMQLRSEGVALELTSTALAKRFAQPSGRIVVLAHGLCMNDHQWLRHGHNHGAVLAQSVGMTPLYLHYNSGLHVSTNGRQFAALLEALLKAWPVPVEQLCIVGYSMGGLLARSACHEAQQTGQAWLARLRQLVFVGTPHHGAPLERGGRWLDAALGLSPYTAAFSRLARLRSAGVTDLRHGSVLDSDWADTDRFAHARDSRGVVPLPAHVDCYAVAASLSQVAVNHDAALLGDVLGDVLGDGLVPVASALGRHKTARRRLPFAADHQRIVYGTSHLGLLDNAEVSAQLLAWLAPTSA